MVLVKRAKLAESQFKHTGMYVIVHIAAIIKEEKQIKRFSKETLSQGLYARKD